MRLRVAGLQIAVTPNIERNVRAIEGGLRWAARRGADIVLTPEGSLSGYTPRFDRAKATEALKAVTGLARDLGVALALGTCWEEPDGLCYNQVRLYDAEGRYLGFHAKQLRCGSMEPSPVGEIGDYAVAPLRVFPLAGVHVGALICNDLWANPTCTPMDDPHLTHRLAQMGARVVLHAVNGGRNGGPMSRLCWRYHESNLRLRALASRLWVVTVDSAEPVHLPCSAPSGVVAPSGEWTVRARVRGEDRFIGDLDVGPRAVV